MPRSNAPHPYGPRAVRRARRHQPPPPQTEPAAPRRNGKAHRPRVTPLEAPHRDGLFGKLLLSGLGRDIGAGGGSAFMHVYGGTVPAATVADRRDANRAARKARRATRR